MNKPLLSHIFALGLMLIASVGAFAQVHKYKLTGTSVKDAANLTGTDDQKTVYLLNVGKYEHAASINNPFFIGRGQTWGTQIIISNIPLPLKIEEVDGGYRIKTTVQENGTTYEEGQEATGGYIGFINDENDKCSYFDDRGLSDNIVTTFTPVDGKTNVYKMTHQYNSKKYTAAALHNPNGTDNANREDHVNGFDDVELTKAFSDKYGPEYLIADDDQWMIITRQQLIDYFAQVDAAQNDPAIATFLIKDADFARADNDVSKWTTERNGTKDNLGNDFKRADGDQGAYFSPNSNSYFNDNLEYSTTRYGMNYFYVGNGWHSDANNNNTGAGQKAHGGQWTANILGKGKIYQDVILDGGLRGGWYAVRVSATTFRNTENETDIEQDKNVKLFANLSYSNENFTKYNKHAESLISADKRSPESFIQANDWVNDGKHEASVLIYINGDDTNTNKTIPNNTTLTVGIDATADGVKDDDNVRNRTYTCFDNFQLYYLGDPKNVVLLNEDETKIDYINKQNTFVNTKNLTEGDKGDRTKSTVHLKRTMNACKWNTLVLPFSIEEDVVLQTFGAGTVYAVLEGATDNTNPTTIYFNRETDGIEKGKLYLIKPTNSQPIGLASVSSSTLKDGSTTEPLITWGTANTNDQSYWTFEAVDFGNNKNADGSNVDYQENVYTKNQGPETVADGTVYFAGTYISHGETKKIPKDSYVLSSTDTDNGSKAGTWYYRTTETRTKGFRGWLQTKEPTTSTTEPTTGTNSLASFYVDGVTWPVKGDENTTGIDNLTINGMKVVIRDNNVYNLQGQRVRRGTSLEGLAEGIYVVNGKKVLVK